MRAQASVEITVVLVAIVALFAVFVTIYQNQLINLWQAKDRVETLDTAYMVANAINYVYLAGEGASYDFFIVAPRKNITATGYFVIAESTTGAFLQAPLLDSVANTVVNNSGKIRIENTGENIVIR